MKKYELEELLIKKGVPDSAFSINGIRRYEALCLIEGEKWKVVYNSRGNITFSQEFDTEEEACKFIYNEMKKDYGF